MATTHQFDFEIEPEGPLDLPEVSFDIEVIRSARRKKSSQARLLGDRLVIRIPAHVSTADEAELINHFRDVFKRRQAANQVDLSRRASQLAAKYEFPTPATIRWVSNQNDRWGSCTPARASIRISDRMARFPPWVIDYVIIHELAHLVVSGHGTDFWALVQQYPLTERARGYLMAKSQL